MPVVTILLMVLLSSLLSVDAICDKTQGPAGTSLCLPIEGYVGNQWATCLTEPYILRKSRGQHECVEAQSAYCWYQCMIEVHDKGNGTVETECACTPDQGTPHSPNTTLDHSCFSPPGDTCSWYRDCLERQFPCREASDSYVVAYPEKMCRLYARLQDQEPPKALVALSNQGQRWLDAVRKCLQVELVPLLRPFESGNVTCASIRVHALKSHASCYTRPYVATPSICELSASDFWTSFWAMRGEFSSYFVESLLGLIQVTKGCRNPDPLQLMGSMKYLKIRLDASELQRNKRAAYLATVASSRQSSIRGRRETVGSAGFAKMRLEEGDGLRVARQTLYNAWQGESADSLEYHRLAAQAVSQLDRQLGWSQADVIVFTYGERAGDWLDVHVLLANRHAFGLQEEQYAQPPDMDALVQDAAEAVELGQVSVTLDGQEAPVAALSACSDVDCRDAYGEATPPPTSSGVTKGPPTGAAVARQGSTSTLAVCLGLGMFLCGAAFSSR